MKTTPQTRLARLAGLTALSLLVLAVGVQAAGAAALAGTQGRGGVTLTSATSTQLQGLTAAAAAQHQGTVVFVPAAAAGNTNGSAFQREIGGEKIYEAGRWRAFFPRHIGGLVTSFPVIAAHGIKPWR